MYTEVQIFLGSTEALVYTTHSWGIKTFLFLLTNQAINLT
jgi:hypothetical protein